MSSSKPYLDYPLQTYALLSIRPSFVKAILKGSKRYEFRRVIFSRRVDTIVVYVTSPVKKALFEFDVADIVKDSTRTLWGQTEDYAGIPREFFFKYFQGRTQGYAIRIGEIRKYHEPLDIHQLYGLRPPQSFVYLTPEQQEKVYKATTFSILRFS